MQKKKLLSLPIQQDIDVPAMQHIEEIVEEMSYGSYKYNLKNYCYKAVVDKTTDESVLIVDVFKPSPYAEFQFRLFQTDKKWFTVYPDGKTSERSLDQGPWSSSAYGQRIKYHPFNEDDDKTISDFIYKNSYIRFEGNGIEQIESWQKQIRNQRLKDKYKRIKDSISQSMLEIRTVPKAFNEWIVNSAMKQYRYLFYEATKKKQTTAHCSHCGQTVVVETPHKGDVICCPNCKSKCECKPLRAYLNTHGFETHEKVSYIQPMKNGKFCFRLFNIYWRWNGMDCNFRVLPSKDECETMRAILRFDNNGKIEVIESFERDFEYKGGDWRKDYYCYANDLPYSKIFPGTLNRIFKSQPDFKKYHFDFNKVARFCGNMKINDLWYCANNIEFLMNLVNSKLYNLAHDIITCGSQKTLEHSDIFDIYKGSLRKGCGISKDELPLLQKVNPNINELRLLRAYQGSGKPFDFSSVRGGIEFYRYLKRDSVYKVLLKILKYSSWNLFLKFYNSQKLSKSHNGYSWNDPRTDFIEDYIDYLKNAELLEYKMNDPHILFPKNFKEAHNITYKIVNDKEFKDAELPQIARQFESYNRLYGFSDDKFLIKPPLRHNELKTEGQILNHCVATYAQRVALGETIILFIRKKDEADKPYFTLNLDPESLNIIQCRGYGNCSYPQEVKRFMDKWYKEKIEPMKRYKENKKCLKTTAA